MVKMRLGLDIGTNSLGWCLLKLNAKGEPEKIENTGVRIFDDGRDAKSLASLKADRRVARSARRRRDRYLQRRADLIKALIKHGFMPKNEAERKALALKDPYLIRAKAVGKKVNPFEVGRAFFHLNQRRGFKSNRKTAAADKETGVVHQSIKKLRENLEKQDAKTFGEYLAKRREGGDTVRARRLGTKQNDLYELYPNRAMYEAEFDAIWEKQAKYDPSFYTKEKRDEIRHIIFHQRKLKPQQVGRCTFIPEEERIPKALPSFQRFRIYQELANLQWIDRSGKGHSVKENPELRDIFAENLEKKKKFSFTAMAKIIKKLEIADYTVSFNLASESRQHLDGNLTACEMRHKDRIGAEWDEWDLEKQDALITLLLDDEKEDEDVEIILKEEYSVSQDRIESVLNATLTAGHGMLSKAAIDRIMPLMKEQGMQYWDAVEGAGLGSHNLYNPNKSLAKRLDYYGKVLSGDVLPGTGNKEDNDEKRWGIIPNPTVHIALNQIRQVVNELIRRYGKPEQIVIELARDLPMGADDRRKIQKRQDKNRERNEDIGKELEKQGIKNNRDNRQKYQLWEELAENPVERRCPFTGKSIGRSLLFTDEIEIEHLLPFSQTLDDSMANKTVCFRQANRDKNNRSPYDAFGSSPDGYKWVKIMDCVKNFPKNKFWRFQPDAMQHFEEEGGFLERHINDTRYISRYTKNYLSSVVDQDKIYPVTGRLTALLRGYWGLNSVLGEMRKDKDSDKTPNKKLRDDHRHHAIDAVVIAMTSRSMVQFVSSAARKGEKVNSENSGRLFANHKDIDPWENFRSDVKGQMEKLIISHRPRKKNQGALHNETAYGFVKGKPGEAVHRILVDSIDKPDTLKKIRDKKIREALIRQTGNLTGKDFKEKLQAWCKKMKIRSVRIVENLSLIPIYDKDGKAYKGYKGDSNAYMDIYPDSKEKWRGEVVSRFDANNPKGFIPDWRKKHPNPKKIMTLRIGDTVKMIHNGNEGLYRIQKMAASLEIHLSPIYEANPDQRHRDKDDPFKFVSKMPGSLQKSNARKVHISSTGLVREEKS